MFVDDSWYEDYFSLRSRQTDAAKLLAANQWLLVDGVATLEPRRLTCEGTSFFGQYTLPFAFKIFLRLKSSQLVNTLLGWKHAISSGNGYQIIWSAEDTIVLQRLDSGTATTLASATVSTVNDTYFTIEILRSQDGNISIIINSNDIVNYVDTTYIGDNSHNYYFFMTANSSAKIALTDGHLRDAVFSHQPYCRNLASNAEYGISYDTYYKMPYITLTKNTNAKIKLINDLLPNTDYYLMFSFTLDTFWLSGLRIFFVTPDEKAGYYVECFLDGFFRKIRIVAADGTIKATSNTITDIITSFNIHFNSSSQPNQLSVSSENNAGVYVSYPATGSIIDTLPSGLVMMLENISTNNDIKFNGCGYAAGSSWTGITNKNAVTSDNKYKIIQPI